MIKSWPAATPDFPERRWSALVNASESQLIPKTNKWQQTIDIVLFGELTP
jgi:hypothetical protein